MKDVYPIKIPVGPAGWLPFFILNRKQCREIARKGKIDQTKS